jgi:hypothetical protein
MSQFYEIRVKGHLDSSWSDWLDGMRMFYTDDGETLLTGYVVDQSALHGLLNRLRDIGIPLISVNPVDKGTDNGGEDGDESSR